MAFLESTFYRSVASFLLSSQRLRAHEARVPLGRPLTVFGLCWIREFSIWDSLRAVSCSRQTSLLCTGKYSLLSVLTFPCICGMQKDAPREVLGLSFSKFFVASDRTAKGMGGQCMVGNRNNRGTALCEFTSPFHGCSIKNSVLCFYFSHVSHTTCLLIDESVRPWGHKLPFVFLPWWKVLKESQRCYCNRN